MTLKIEPWVSTGCECEGTGRQLDDEGVSEDFRRVYKDCELCAGTAIEHCSNAADGCCARVEHRLTLDGVKRVTCGDTHCVDYVGREMERRATWQRGYTAWCSALGLARAAGRVTL